MTEREQLREALQTWKREHAEALDIADVLAVLDQQGWVSPDVHADALAASERISAEVLEAARYEQVGAISTDSRGYLNFFPLDDAETQAEWAKDYPDDVPLYRRVTTAGED